MTVPTGPGPTCWHCKKSWPCGCPYGERILATLEEKYPAAASRDLTIGPYGDRTDEAAGIVRGWPIEQLKLGYAPASRDNTDATIKACEEIERDEEPRFDLVTTTTSEQASRDSTRGTVCERWCGQSNGGVLMSGKPSRLFCTDACRYAGKPIHPAPQSTRGTCATCGGSGWVPDNCGPGYSARCPSCDGRRVGGAQPGVKP
jgi:hypothetical protein